MSNLIEHKRAHFDYEILEHYEAGVQLFGTEVKSLREHRGKLEGAHITVRGGEAYLINSEIPPYQPGNTPGYEPTRNRRLLLTKKELGELARSEEKAGLTIVPLSMYNKGRVIKLRLGVAATNLGCVTDVNSVIDVFVRDLNPATPASCGTPSAGGTAKGGGGGVWSWALLAWFILYGLLRHRSLQKK